MGGIGLALVAAEFTWCMLHSNEIAPEKEPLLDDSISIADDSGSIMEYDTDSGEPLTSQKVSIK